MIFRQIAQFESEVDIDMNNNNILFNLLKKCEVEKFAAYTNFNCRKFKKTRDIWKTFFEQYNEIAL